MLPALDVVQLRGPSVLLTVIAHGRIRMHTVMVPPPLVVDLIYRAQLCGRESGIRTHGPVRVVDKYSKFNEASRPPISRRSTTVRVPSEPTTKSIARQSLFAVAVDSRPKDRGSAFIVRAGCVGRP